MMIDILNDMKQGGCCRIADGLPALGGATPARRVCAAASARRPIGETSSTASDRGSPSAGGEDSDGSAGGTGGLPRGINWRSPSTNGGDLGGSAGGAGVLPIDRRSPSASGGDPDG